RNADMESLDVLLSVSLIWIVAAVTPGPNFFLTIHTAVGEDRHRSLCAVLGIVTGTFIWAVSGFLGISIVFKTMPYIYYFLKILGGAYLVYIGLKLLVFNKQTQTNNENKAVARKGPVSCFKLGLYTNILNPKTAAFMTSLFAATIPQDASYQFSILCVLSICLISAAWYSFVSIVFSHENAKKIYMAYRLCIERMAGMIFMLFGIKLITTE
ncbi:MAG: LysE family translocator, partial [Desulfobacterales bacterium]|nr:LysE family translocator [Desulfobacterales bacterium]